jgi:hypothetical protein
MKSIFPFIVFIHVLFIPIAVIDCYIDDKQMPWGYFLFSFLFATGYLYVQQLVKEKEAQKRAFWIAIGLTGSFTAITLIYDLPDLFQTSALHNSIGCITGIVVTNKFLPLIQKLRSKR